MNKLLIGHSPDADDAFMFYALATGAVAVGEYEVDHEMEDIESLNRRARTGELPVTAISAAVYPEVANLYRIMSCGSSIGLRLYAGRDPGFEPVAIDFDRIMDAVASGEVDAGIIIHEGQITWQQSGLHKVIDLGEAWMEDTGLPIPLGLDVINRSLDDDAMTSIASALKESIVYAREHEEDAIDYAMQFGRGIDRETCRRFVRMYVNDDTVDMGEDGRRALETLYARASEMGLIREVPPLDIIQV